MKRAHPINLETNGRYALIRLTAEAQAALEKSLFQRHPHREWGTFFRFGFRRTRWGLALSFVEGLWPQGHDLDRQSSIVEFHPDYVRRAVQALERDGPAVGVIHSHPLGYGVYPSNLDDDMDGYFGDLFIPYAKSAPYVSLIINRDQHGRFVFSGRVLDRGVWLPVRHWKVAGDETGAAYVSGLSGAEHEEDSPDKDADETTTARWSTLVGDETHRKLAGATVGVIGCSGTGSPAVEVLARAGVANFVLVDFQRLAPSNLERIHGALHADSVKEPLPYKVKVAADHIHAINPRAKVTAIVGNMLDDRVFDELLRCDLLLSCTDTEHARAVLGDYAHHYLLPSLDVGVLMEASKGKISGQVVEMTRYTHVQPCAFCSGRIQQRWLEYELMSEKERTDRAAAAAVAIAQGIDGAQYWGGQPPALTTVGFLTTTAGGLLGGYALGYLLGVFSMPHSRFQFDPGMPLMGAVAGRRAFRPHCSCNRNLAAADQALADRSVSRPAHWRTPFFVSLES